MLSSAIAKQDIYIFKAMLPAAGYSQLKDRLEEFNAKNLLSEIDYCLWLIRESNIPGMLTIDYVKLNDKSKEWDYCSTRMALTAAGWVNAVNPQGIVMLTNITAETAGLHEESLTEYVKNLQNGRFGLKNRLNPRKDQQTQCTVYTTYTVNGDQGEAARARRLIELSPGVRDAISSELSGKTFKNPVVMVKDMKIRVRGWSFIDLHKGHSYEESELKDLGVRQDEYYKNFLLEKIINRLGSEDEAKIDSMGEDKLEDSVQYEQMQKPVIIPSGHSYSESTINDMYRASANGSMKCPLTQAPFTMNQVVENTNLARVIQEWGMELSVRKRLKI